MLETTTTAPAPPRPSSLSGAATALLLGTIGAITAWLGLVPASSWSSAPLQAHLLILVVAAVEMISAVARDRLRPARFAAFAFIAVWWGVAPIIQMVTDRYPLGLSYEKAELRSASLATMVAVVALAVGVGADARRAASRSTATTARGRDAHLIELVRVSRRLLLSLWALLVVSALAVVYIGPSAYFSTRSGYSAQLGGAVGDSAARGLVQALARIAPLAVLLVCLHFRWGGRGQAGVPFKGRRLLLASSAMIATITANPVATSRYWSGTVVLSVVFLAIYHRRIGRRVARAALCIYLLAFLTIFPYLDHFRRAESSLAIESPRAQITDSLQYDSYTSIVGAVRLNAEEGWSGGIYTIVAPLTFFVPRSIWEGKPTDAAVEIQRVTGVDDRLNLASALPAELLADFGLLGVAMGMFGLGILLGTIERARWSALVYVFVAAYVPLVLRGSLLNSFASGVPAVALLWWLQRESNRGRFTSTGPTTCLMRESQG